MKFNKILNSNSQEFRDVWKVYVSSFPSNERRDLANQTELLSNKSYGLSAVYDKNHLIGFIATWNFNNCIFIEHFAIQENLRGKGFGTKLLIEYISQRNKKIILEVEKPNTEMASKRIKFYEKIGFKLNTYDYIQPAYGQEKKSIPMFLMTLPSKINKSEFLNIRDQLYKTVYGVKSGTKLLQNRF